MCSLLENVERNFFLGTSVVDILNFFWKQYGHAGAHAFWCSLFY